MLCVQKEELMLKLSFDQTTVNGAAKWIGFWLQYRHQYAIETLFFVRNKIYIIGARNEKKTSKNSEITKTLLTHFFFFLFSYIFGTGTRLNGENTKTETHRLLARISIKFLKIINQSKPTRLRVNTIFKDYSYSKRA